MVITFGIATWAVLPSLEPRERCGLQVTSFHLLLWDTYTDKHSGHQSLCPLRIINVNHLPIPPGELKDPKKMEATPYQEVQGSW